MAASVRRAAPRQPYHADQGRERRAVWQAELVDDYYQPLISNTQSALLANEMSKILKIRNKWKVYEKFWGRRKMYQAYYKAFNQKQSIGFQEELKKLFG